MTIVNYDWDEEEDNIVEEFDDAGTTIAEYTTEPDRFGNVISQFRDGQESFYHYDGLGSTVALTNANGDVTDTYAYSAFGEVTAHTGSTANPFQYVGQKGYYRDLETGQHDVRLRIFSALQARWTSKDWVFGDHELGDYVYNYSNPLSYIDPSGAISISLSTKVKPNYVASCTKDPLLIIKFPFEFTLDNPAPCDGFLFQWVRARAWVRTCYWCEDSSYHDADWDLFQGHEDVSYWEWFGKKGLPPQGLISEGQTGFSGDDSFLLLDDRRMSRPKPFPSCGIAKWEAELRFYCKSQINMGYSKSHGKIVAEYPDQFWTIGVHESGTLPSVGSQPDVWSKTPIESAKWVFIGLFDCCCGRDTVSGKAYSGVSSFWWDSWSDWTVIGAWP